MEMRLEWLKLSVYKHEEVVCLGLILLVADNKLMLKNCQLKMFDWYVKCVMDEWKLYVRKYHNHC